MVDIALHIGSGVARHLEFVSGLRRMPKNID